MDARLIAEARGQGISLEKVAERLLQEALASCPVAQSNLTIEAFQQTALSNLANVDVL